MAFTDDFTAASDENLTARSGWTLVTGTAGWVQADGTTDALEIRTGNSDYVATCTDQGSANQYAKATLKTVNNYTSFMVACRVVDVDNCIGVACEGTGASGLRLVKYVADVKTSLVLIQGVADSVYEVRCNGSTVQLFEDDVQQGGDQTVTDHQTETSQGIVLNKTTVTANEPVWDNFEAGALSTGNELTSRGLHGVSRGISEGVI